MKADIVIAAACERLAQDEKYGGPDHDDDHTPLEWSDFISDHAERGSGYDLKDRGFRRQMVRVIALAVAAIEASDRSINRSSLSDEDKRLALRL